MSSAPNETGDRRQARLEVTPESAAFEPITIVSELCIGCNRCVDACQVDVFLPRSEKGAAPVVMYPGECWHSGDCVAVCPVPGAIRLNVMPKNRVHWKRKTTGEDFYL